MAELQISGINFSNQEPAFHFRSFAGRQYTVEYSADVSSSNWASLIQSGIPGTGGEVVVTDTTAPSTSRFYRVKQW